MNWRHLPLKISDVRDLVMAAAPDSILTKTSAHNLNTTQYMTAIAFSVSNPVL